MYAVRQIWKRGIAGQLFVAGESKPAPHGSTEKKNGSPAQKKQNKR
jgi:hypothetical protein